MGRVFGVGSRDALEDSVTGRVMLLAATRAYRTDDFVAAAQELGIELVLGSDRCHVLAESWPEGALALDFRDVDGAAAAVAASAKERPLAGIVATDEVTALIAAHAAERLGLPGNAPEAAQAAGNKGALRRTLAAAGVAQPGFCVLPRDLAADRVAGALERAGLEFPVVLKPLHLSASRGVMRADDPDELVSRWARLSALLDDPEVAAGDPAAAGQILIESFIAGREVAFEGILDRGQLHPLAIFDKPDPLDGPFFAETLYVTPSTETAEGTDRIVATVAAAARVLGLENGPVHGELRLPPGGRPVVIELAARAIGGLCGRIFQFSTSISLEQLILGHAASASSDRTEAGRGVAATAARVRERLRARGASGVLMMPVPAHGVLRQVRGVAEARAIPGVSEVTITARSGDELVPLPEGNAYLGFAFAMGENSSQVIDALHAVRDTLDIDVASLL